MPAPRTQVRQVSAARGDRGRSSRSCAPTANLYRDVRPLVRVNIASSRRGRPQETGARHGRPRGLCALHRDGAWQRAVDEALRQALVNLESVPAPAGEMDVVLGAGWPGRPAARGGRPRPRGRLQPQEASAFAGLMGERSPPQGVTVVDDGTIPTAAARSPSTTRAPPPTHDADRGRHPRRLHAGPQNARLMGMKPTGNGRRQSMPTCRCRA
jgi:TldD protein